MNRIVNALVLVGCALIGSAMASDDLGTKGSITLPKQPGDCERLVDNGRQVVDKRDRNEGRARVVAALLKPELMSVLQYRVTLPLLISFTGQAYNQGAEMSKKDLLDALSDACRSDDNKEWIYFP